MGFGAFEVADLLRCRPEFETGPSMGGEVPRLCSYKITDGASTSTTPPAQPHTGDDLP
jgi:hypothetical protein